MKTTSLYRHFMLILISTMLISLPIAKSTAQVGGACLGSLSSDDLRYVYDYILNELVRSPLTGAYSEVFDPSIPEV
jgi:hypothetical protein